MNRPIVKASGPSVVAVVDLIRRTGRRITIAEVFSWPLELRDAAYLWAVDWKHGIENVPPPWEVAKEAM